MVRRGNQLLISAIILIMCGSLIPLSDSELDLMDSIIPTSVMEVSANPGYEISLGYYIVVELPDSSIGPYGSSLNQLLTDYGIPSRLHTLSEITAEPTLLTDAICIILDASLGESDGSAVPDSFIQAVLQVNAPTIMMGRSSWLLHRFRGQGPPSLTAPQTTILLPTPGYEGAVYLSSPLVLSIGNALTTESGFDAPKNEIQGVHSRLIDLTGRLTQIYQPSLQYCSWPVDTYLLNLENPSALTFDGEGLLINTIAYATALSDTTTSQIVSKSQSQVSPLIGGFSYLHQPTLEATYYAVKAIYSLLETPEWTIWQDTNSELIEGLLSSLYLDFGSDAGFLSSSHGSVGNVSTAQGLWLTMVMSLESSFAISKLVSYLATRQDTDGGYGNSVVTTFNVVEALQSAGSLYVMNLNDLENWLDECRVNGADTSNPDLWGGIGKNPTSADSRNSYAYYYVNALSLIGGSPFDSTKLTEWILDHTSNPDGSYDDSTTPSQEVAKGTACALATMNAISTLSAQNRTTGLSWLNSNQLPSGGYGLGLSQDDIVGKTRESHYVALALNELGESSSSSGQELLQFMVNCRTDVGFEGMETIPSLMWSYWMSSIARYSHAYSSINIEDVQSYLEGFPEWTQYPYWSNLTSVLAYEYGMDQYRGKSVWTQYFGIGMYDTFALPISSGVHSQTQGYIQGSQSITGHFRPAFLFGIPHMQWTTAAVEALYMIDALDSINYRSALETAVMNEYSSGSWSKIGWTIEPYSSSQSSVDWLCTRAALRLDLITETMATEIASSIQSRIQYTDLWSLSRDVSTLALLNSSGFSVSLESVNPDEVLINLGATPFTSGWYNSTLFYQPIFTENVLELVSILGLRNRLNSIDSSAVAISTSVSADVGDTLDIDVIISSATSTHNVTVNAFDHWYRFEHVLNTDTLAVPVPEDPQSLGQWDICVVLTDWQSVRAFDSSEVTVSDTLVGSLNVHTPSILMGDLINVTASWTLSSGTDAGTSTITVDLSGASHSDQWIFSGESPYIISIPSDDFPSDSYTLTITVSRPFCSNLILQEEIDILIPNPTYIDSVTPLVGDAGFGIAIPWSLRFQSNGTTIPYQQVFLEIKDSESLLIYSDEMISSSGTEVFTWVAGTRGNYSFTLIFNRNDSIEGSTYVGTIRVFESTEIAWLDSAQRSQYSTSPVCAFFRTTSGSPLVGYEISVSVTNPSMQVVVNQILTTNSTGHISVIVEFLQNGIYIFDADFLGTYNLRSAHESENVVSYSDSFLQVGGIEPEGLVVDSLIFWSVLTDSVGFGIQGQQVILRIILQPSTTIYEESLITNQAGYISTSWSASIAGDYRFEAYYVGSSSRGSAADSQASTIRAPVTLDIQPLTSLEVGSSCSILVECRDHTGTSISGLSLSIVIRDTLDYIVFTDSGVSVDGSVTFIWTPNIRGENTITVNTMRQGFYESSMIQEVEDVFEQTELLIYIDSNPVAPGSILFSFTVRDQSGQGVAGVTLNIEVLLDLTILMNQQNMTDASGCVSLGVYCSQIGELTINANLDSQQWLLSASNSSSTSLYGASHLSLNISGIPIEQGTILGITATLTDWEGYPIVGEQVTIEVTLTNGTVISSRVGTTGVGGSCSHAHEFSLIGDFWIHASYAGVGINAAAEVQLLQRVHLTPTLILTHPSSIILGTPCIIEFGIVDAYDSFVTGLDLLLRISPPEGGDIVNMIPSGSELTIYNWTPTTHGLTTISLDYSGGSIYLSNSTSSSMSVLLLINGEILIEEASIDVFDTLFITYHILSGVSEVEIMFELLGPDLVPVWITSSISNESGYAVIEYQADDTIGLLTITAEPNQDEFLMGGYTQTQLRVRTHVLVVSCFEPEVPTLGSPMNITVYVEDELGMPINNLDVTISLNDPNGNPVKLGIWTNSISVSVIDGYAVTSFDPVLAGIYTLYVASGGSLTIYAFNQPGVLETVYCPTTFYLQTQQIEFVVNDSIELVGRLIDLNDNPMSGKTVVMLADGPGTSGTGPISLITNSTGFIAWKVTVVENGHWAFIGTFNGIGVYLASSDTYNIDVKEATSIDVSVLTTEELIAGLTPLELEVLLEDSTGTVVELGIVSIDAYHDELGLILETSVTQTGYLPEKINLTLSIMGDYTIVFSFSGSSSYHPSNTAIRVWVRGTSEISVEHPVAFDRSDEANVTITILNEQGLPITFSEDELTLSLNGLDGLVDLSKRMSIVDSHMTLNLTSLLIGEYTLQITYPDNILRLGSSEEIEFRVTSSSYLSIAGGTYSGIIGDPHDVIVLLTDSLNASLSGVEVRVSLFDPEGREVYGSPLSTVTNIMTQDGLVTVEWNPSRIGNYSLLVEFSSTDYIFGSTLELVILTRYLSILDATIPDNCTYPDEVVISAALAGSNGKIRDASIVVTISKDGELVIQENGITNALGTVDIQIPTLSGGLHTVTVSYLGSDRYAPDEIISELLVYPGVVVFFYEPIGAYTGKNLSLAIDVNIGGISTDWQGVVSYELHGPAGLILSRSEGIVSDDLIEISFVSSIEGDYYINFDIQGIPITGNYSDSFIFTLVIPPVGIPLDTSTTTITGGSLILLVVGLVARRKLHSILEVLPTEWEG